MAEQKDMRTRSAREAGICQAECPGCSRFWNTNKAGVIFSHYYPGTAIICHQDPEKGMPHDD